MRDEETPDPELWRLWRELPQIGGEHEGHASGLRGCAFADLDALAEPVYVQEVYIMDNFMRALAEFRSPQGTEQRSIPVPCVADEPLDLVKRRLFEQVRHNFIAIQELSTETKLALYGSEYHAKDDRWIRCYSWVDTIFADGWTEADLKWFAYQEYDSYLDPDMWKFYGPNMRDEIYDETKVFRVKERTAKYKKQLGMTKVSPGLAKSTSVDAVYLLPTHIRVMLWREGFDMLMYTLPRDTTFAALKHLVEIDLNKPGIFTKFDCGPPDTKFGPGKSFADVFPPTTVGVSHTWS